MKLSTPVDNEHLAFCTLGCHTSFYLKRCRVCEATIVAKRRRVLCHKADCATEYRRFGHLYRGPEPAKSYDTPADAELLSEVPVKWAFKPDPRRVGWSWFESAGAYELIDAQERVVGCFRAGGDGYRVVYPAAWPEQRAATVEDARRLTLSLALANRR
jgi:hypothetical protein